MEKKKIPNTILIAFAVLNLLHLLVSKGERVLGHFVLYLVPAVALLMILAAIGYAVSLFICYEKEARKKIHLFLAGLLFLLCIAPTILGIAYATDLAGGTIKEETDLYTIGGNCVFLNREKETKAVNVTDRQQKFLLANEPPKNLQKKKILESGVFIYAHEERLSVEYYERTGIAKSVTYLRNK